MHRTFALAFTASLLSLAMITGHGCGFQTDPRSGSDFEVDNLEVDEVQLDDGLAQETMTLTDESRNSVTLLITSKNREEVDRFLDNTDMSIETLGGFRPRHSDDDAPIPPEVGEEAYLNITEEDRAVNKGLVIKVVGRLFGPGTEAFTLKFRGKETMSRSDLITPAVLGLSPILQLQSGSLLKGLR